MSKTRLLFVVHSLCIGGTERLVTQISSALNKDEYEIGICCLDARGRLWDECQSSGYTLFEINRKPGWQLKTFSSIAGVFKEFQPEVVHAHQYTPYVYAVAGKIIGCSKAKIIFTEHGRHFPDIVSSKRRAANILLKNFASRITAVSEFSKTALSQKEGFDHARIEVVYNGLQNVECPSHSDISLHDELGLDISIPLIGYIGSLREVKNPAYLIEMFSHLAQWEFSSQLVIIGDGPLRGRLESQVRDLGLENRVNFLGARNPATPYISSLTVFALPSLSEAASLALLEAMARGIPAIATNTGGTPELIADGESGVLVPTNDAKHFAEQVALLLTKPELRDTIGISAQTVIKERFSFEHMMDSYRRLYEELR